MGLTTRYPELEFLMNITPRKNLESLKWPEFTANVGDVEVLYVFGCSPKIDILLRWLEEDVNRDVVFIEDDLSVISQMKVEKKDEIFAHEQIHLRVFLPESDIELFAEDLANAFPYKRIAFSNLKKNQETFELLKMHLLRKSVVTDAVANEMLFYHKLFYNLRKNLARLPQSFDMGKWKGAFKDVPAILCGAGPSLATMQDKIINCKNKALVLAGGSTITALNALGITPDLAFAVDPNDEEFTRLMFHTSYDTPLIYALRVNPEIFHSHAGPLGYFSTGTGGSIEKWIEKEIRIEDAKILEGLSEEAMSVTSVALMTAVYLGCNPIVLAGIDLAYDRGKRYAPGVITDLQCSLEEKLSDASQMPQQKNGKETATKWIMESDVLSKVAGQFPNTTFIDGRGEGIGFETITCEKEFDKKWSKTFDFKSTIHELVIKTPLDCPLNVINEKLQEFQQSMKRSLILVETILVELEKGQLDTPKLIVLEMDLEEELSYKIALKSAIFAWTFPIQKEHRPMSDLKNLLRIKIRLYAKIKSIIKDYISYE